MSQSSSLTSTRVWSPWRVLVAAALLLAMGATGNRALAQPDAGPLPVVAFVASADNFPDALAAGAVAGTLGAPVLLTSPAALGEAAAEALVAVGPDLVVLAGGPAALSPQVETDVVALGFEARRVSGDDRTRTAEALAAFAAELGAGRPVVTGRPVTDATIPGLDADSVDGLDGAELAGSAGPAGPAGPAGAEGPAGPEGATGDDGPAGSRGPAGQPGPDGQDGSDGQEGSDGQDGQDGVDGQDATALWAVVNADGTLRNGSGVVGASRREDLSSSGAYGVTFDRDVTGCALIATSVFGGGNISARAGGGDDDAEARVLIYSDSYQFQDKLFNLVVFC